MNVCGPAPVILKLIVFIPTVLLAAVMASRKDITPSAPLLLLSALTDEVSPSDVSVVESTTTITGDGLADNVFKQLLTRSDLIAELLLS